MNAERIAQLAEKLNESGVYPTVLDIDRKYTGHRVIPKKVPWSQVITFLMSKGFGFIEDEEEREVSHLKLEE